MPWCDSCDRFWNPNSVQADGTCPTCGRELEAPAAEVGDGGEQPSTKIPWHFWVMFSALALYLGWRLVEGVIWVVEQVAG